MRTRVDWNAPALRHMTTAPRIRHCERMMRTATSVAEREMHGAEIRRLRGQNEPQPTITVPADMVDPLREGVYRAIDSAIHTLAQAKLSPGRKVDPERYEQLEGAQALRDRIGRTAAVPPLSVEVDLDEHCFALLDALHHALHAETRLLESPHGDTGPDPQERAAITARRDELAELISTVEAQDDARHPTPTRSL